jgi:fatty-acyl-CoA synthase
VETRVVNDDLRDVAVGEVGEIVHRSPHLMLGACAAEHFAG